jgi:chromate transporter
LTKLQGDELAEKVIRNCVNTTLEHDLNLVPFEYYKSELGTLRTLEIPSLKEELSFFGKIDRIDVKNDCMRIIDYKTGSATLDFTSMSEIFGRSKNTEDEELSIRNEGNRYILQTLLYCWLLEGDKRIQVLQEKHANALGVSPGIYSVRQLNDESKPTYLHKKGEEVLYTRDIADEFINQLTLAQSVPGPIALNTAVFVGYKTRGAKGALAALVGVVIPSFVIILLIALYFTDFKDNPTVAAAFKGMRPAVVALIAAPIINMARGMSWWKIAVALGAAVVIWLLGVSPIAFIIIGALVGIGWSFRSEGATKDRGKEGER